MKRIAKEMPTTTVAADGDARPPGLLATAIAGMMAHPWTVVISVAAALVIIIAIHHMTKAEQPPAVAVQQTLPAGANMPTIVAVKDDASGCTVRLYYDGERLVSVLPALKKGGEPDCPGA